MEFQLSSSAFVNDQAIPREHTCEGDNTSPPLRWSDTPSGTRSLALILHDPDSSYAGGYDHWLIYDLPPAITEIPSSKYDSKEFPLGGFEGANSSGSIGYVGPCPKPGPPHRYRFTLYALQVPTLGLPAGANRKQLQTAMQGKTLAEAELVGRFQR